MIHPSRILILSPHTDDGELGCGGSIARFCEAGKEVFYVAFSNCASSLPQGLPADTLDRECRDATATLGVRASNLFILNYEVREFPSQRQAILQDMIRLRNEIRPELVFIPSESDIHQDHQVVHQEAIRAFKHDGLIGYELPWNQSSFKCQLFLHLEKSQMEKKINALKKYQSQAGRNYMTEEFIRSLATVRGVQANTEYAEAFEVYRLNS